MGGGGEAEVLKFMITYCPDAFQAERERAPRGAGLNKSQLKLRYIGITEKPERGDNAERGTKG